MRCPECNRFVSFETRVDDVELEIPCNPERDADGLSVTIDGSARLLRECAECGTELSEANLQIAMEIELTVEPEPEEELRVSCESYEVENTGGVLRCILDVEVTGKEGRVLGSGTFSEEVAASDFDAFV